jgi:hypothetical protein
VSAIPLERDSSAARTRAVAPAPKDWGRLVAEGRAARAQADGGRWRIGHLADMVEHRYRSRAVQQFADDIGESYSTVRRYRWVVTRYEPGVRFRFPGLAFSHFQAVAGRPDRVAWLERAELGCWSVDRLVQESRGRTADATASPMPRLRAALGGAVRSLSDVEALDDKALARAAREWLGETLDELEERVVSVRERLSAVVKPKTTSLNRYKVTGRKTKGRAAHPAANGKAKPASKLPVNPF